MTELPQAVKDAIYAKSQQIAKDGKTITEVNNAGLYREAAIDGALIALQHQDAGATRIVTPQPALSEDVEKRFAEIFYAATGGCTCDEAYKSRQLNDPGCAACNTDCEDAAKDCVAIHQRHLLAATAPLKEEIERLKEERDALQRFKDFTHCRLDEMGIPTHPDGEVVACGAEPAVFILDGNQPTHFCGCHDDLFFDVRNCGVERLSVRSN